jgi:hypothetical protein
MNSRDEHRYDTDQPVVLTILGNPDVRVLCRVVNVSRSGMRVAVDRQVACGAAIRVEWDKHFLVGKAVHVSRKGGEYFVGLQLLTCSAWKGGAARFLPLRLKSLAQRVTGLCA